MIKFRHFRLRLGPLSTPMRSELLMRAWLNTMLWLALVLVPGFALAQRPSKSVPTDAYYLGYPQLLDGEFGDAAAIYRRAGQTGMRAGDARWVDAICYHAMMGECYYRLGQLPQALEQYNNAIDHFLGNRDWLLRTEFPATITEQNPRNVATWGTTARVFRVGTYPRHYQTMVGRLDNQDVLQRGGVVANPEIYPVNVVEILRCFAQAIRRRTEIMGPVCQYDPLTLQLVDALSRRPGPPNHWSQCWLSLCLGLSYAAAEKDAQAVSELTQSLLAGGTYDHPLTAMGILELGKLSFKKGENDTAATLFMEATYAAVTFDQADILEEAFKSAVTSWAVAGKAGPFPPLANAIDWARQKQLRSLHTTLLTLAAEGALESNDARSAAQFLSRAKSAMTGSQLLASDVGARYNFVTAWLAFQTGKMDAGSTALAAAMAWQTTGSRRLFQIGLVDVAASSGNLTARVAELLYADTLREPLARDWLVDPHDTLAVLSTPHPLPFEHWFEICLARKDTAKALEVADRLRRHRFYSTVPLGGRLEALRWVLEAPVELISQEAKLQKQALLIKFPVYEQAVQKVREIKGNLQQLPPDGQDRTKALAELSKFVLVQELILREMAVRRDPSDFSFPPLRETSDIQQGLPDGTLMLAYLATSRQVHAFAVTNKQMGHWVVEKPGTLKSDLQEMLTSWGLFDRTQQIASDDLKNDAWWAPAERLGAALTNQMKPEDWQAYTDLVVVPDKLFWHIPFEALPAGTGSKESLLARVNVRYVPTAALALPDGRPSPRAPKTVLVLGRPTPRDPEANIARASAEALPNDMVVERWTQDLPAPSYLARQLCDRLLVMADIEDSDKGPYAWAPMVLDRNKQGSQLVDWFSLPWGGPHATAFTSFHTAAETSLKKGGNGDEIFLTVCGLMAAGSRTIVLSRWRMGGSSTIDLMREYHQELGYTSAAKSWRRSVRLMQESNLLVETEPRIRGNARDALSGQHPIFWAGYILCDTGNEPKKEEPQP